MRELFTAERLLFASSVTACDLPCAPLTSRETLEPSQITYGTDYPYFGLGQFRNLEGVGLSAVELEFIGSGNATRLIPRLRN